VNDKQRAIRSQRYKYIRSDFPKTPGGHLLIYRDSLDMTLAWRKAFQQGLLTPLQSAWFEPPGREQLYDLIADPHETNNLAHATETQQIKRLMSEDLDHFLARIGDSSDVPESQMRDRLLKHGQIPITPEAVITWKDGKAKISSPIEASIGYRRGGEKRWQIYTQPISAASIEAKSVRYGWQSSKITRSQRPIEKLGEKMR
jgi:hypothetical protein